MTIKNNTPGSIPVFHLYKLVPLFLILISLQSQVVADTSSIKQLLETKACPQCNLRGADLSNQNLQGVNLQAADLTGADLSSTNLRGANLSHSILKQVNFDDTLLAGANLRNADLTDLDIDVAFEWMEIIGTLLEGARFKDGVTCGPFPKKGGWGCQHL